MALAPGDKFGRYSIVGTIGMGGMGQVLRAVDSVLERPVALKIIRADKSDRDEAVARFFREAKLAAQLTHPNTVQIYDLGEVDGVPFIAMELIDGEPLTRYCGVTSIDPTRKSRWMLGAARGLAAAHKRGMVHRDVKPANMMVITAEDVVKVVDFGLAKRTPTTLEQRKTFQTQLGFVVGTPIYMAPEQFDGSVADALSDQFSWALTAYTLLVGENPRRLDPMLFDPIVPLSKRVPQLPPDAGAVIMTSLHTDPARRHTTMAEVVSALDAALNMPVGRVVVTTGAVPARASVPPVVVNTGASPVRASVPPPVKTTPSTAPMRASVVPSPNAGVVDVDTPRMAPFAVVDHPLAPRPLNQVRVPFFLVPDPVPAAVPKPAAVSDAQVWRFERRADPCRGAPLRLASFAADGKRILAFAEGVVVLHENGAWRELRSSEWLSRQRVVCAALLSDGSAIIGGERGLAARIEPDGGFQELKPERPRPDVCLQGVEVTPGGWVTFVGSAGEGGGVFGWLRPLGLVLADAPMPLAAVVTMRHLRNSLACGPKGALVSCALGVMKVQRCTSADLLALARASEGDGAHVVGAGGHALFATDTLETSMEPVETTTTLTAVTTTEAGTAWAASSRGRILRRDSQHRWLRVSGDMGVEPNLLAIWASEDRVRAVAADGSLVLGWRLRDDRVR